MQTWAFKGGFCAYTISTKALCADPYIYTVWLGGVGVECDLNLMRLVLVVVWDVSTDPSRPRNILK